MITVNTYINLFLYTHSTFSEKILLDQISSRETYRSVHMANFLTAISIIIIVQLYPSDDNKSVKTTEPD